MRLFIFLAITILLAGFAAAECTVPTEGMTIIQNTVLCSKIFDLPSGIMIGADNIELDCDGGMLRGDMLGETGIIVDGRNHVTIKDCFITTYKIGVYIKNSTHITMTKTSLLKNRMGVRLYNSYENNITGIKDQSTETPLSVINSKFNIFLFDNKNIEENFCNKNMCNNLINMSPCEDNDFYCSEKCTPANDSDCKSAQPEIKEAEKQPEPTPQPAQEAITTNNETSTPTAMAVQETQQADGKSKLWLIYIIAYIITFFALQFYAYTQKSIRIKV